MTDSVDLRIGDRERRAVDARLQAAVGDGILTLHEYDERAAQLWEARTGGDLAVLTADLPGHRPSSPVLTPAASPFGPAFGTPPRPRRSLAVMSGDCLSGPFPAGQRLESYAVMGGATVDLRRHDLPAELHVRAVAVMGGVEVLVPRGATVHLSGAAVMGGRDCTLDPPRDGGPVVHLEAWAVMGGVEVKHGGADQDSSVVAAQPRGLVVPARAPTAPVRRTGRARRLLGRVVVVGALAVAAGGALAAGQDGAAVFGSRTVSVQEGSGEVTVLFGSVEVVVPDDARVDTRGMVVFGSVDCEQACDPDQEGDVVQVRSWGGFGSVEVLTQSEAEGDDRDRGRDR